MFIYPVTDIEIVQTVKKFKGKYSAGTDGIPDFVVTKCIEVFKIPLAHIYNASLEAGIFPKKFKIAKVKPLHKKGDKEIWEIIGQSPFYVHSQKFWKNLCITGYCPI
jgi:hypothetical protein